MCLSETGNWQAVKRSEAAAFRRRVLLFNLDMEERDAARKAEQRRLLHAEAEADQRHDADRGRARTHRPFRREREERLERERLAVQDDEPSEVH